MAETRVCLTREQAHAKIDEVYDELEQIGEQAGYPIDLQRIMLRVQSDGSVEGCVLAARTGVPSSMGEFVTWGISPYGAGLHSGHYDMHDLSAETDWIKRVKRGW